MDLPAELGTFDRVHAANLICRLPEPGRLLARLPELVKPGGELVLATPCTWLEDFTPLENWPKGDTLEWLRGWLEPGFSLVKQGEEPFLIRETARKFQWTRSMMTVWKRD
jgi:SAM-dependent methyltransferase